MLAARVSAFVIDQAVRREDFRLRTHVRARLTALLLAVDALALCLGFAIGAAITFGVAWSDQSPVLVGTVGLFYGLCALLLKAYSDQVLVEPTGSLARALIALTMATAILSWLMFLLKTGDAFSRLEVSTGAIVAAWLLALGRYRVAGYARKVLGARDFSLVIRDGTAPPAHRAAGTLDVSDVFDPGEPSPQAFDQLAKVVGRYDRVLVECAPGRRAMWAQVFQGMNVHAEIFAPEFDYVNPLAVSSHEGRTTLVVARSPLSLRERVLKRVFDLGFASIALIACLPLMVIVAIAIKLDSAGPVLFRQPRIGRQNRQFCLYKFRSMQSAWCDPGGRRSATRGDARLTRVGRFIRATSIDELPQFFNVLKGEMSIVGPRPHAVHSTAEDQPFWHVDSRYWHRHACKPGITGLAQIRGLRGATRYKCDLRDRVTADLEYANHWSFWNDVAIVLRTATVLLHRNAY